MATGDQGFDEHTVTGPGIPVPSLDHNTMTWEILVCSFIPGIDSGVVEIVVRQDGAPCPMTKPARWNLTNVPSCDSGQATPIDSALEYRVT